MYKFKWDGMGSFKNCPCVKTGKTEEGKDKRLLRHVSELGLLTTDPAQMVGEIELRIYLLRLLYVENIGQL